MIEDKVDLSIMYSRNCNLSCDHCMYDSGPDIQDHIDMDLLSAFIGTINNNVSTIGYYGGEPTLFLQEYAKITSMVRKRRPEIKIWMISNGTWSKDFDEMERVLRWTFVHRVSPIIVSGTQYHVPNQDRALLESMAAALENHIILKSEEDRYINMGRWTSGSCTNRCTNHPVPIRMAILPDGRVMFQNCDGSYPIVGCIRESFMDIYTRVLHQLKRTRTHKRGVEQSCLLLS